jgi:hypothetical protein
MFFNRISSVFPSISPFLNGTSLDGYFPIDSGSGLGYFLINCVLDAAASSINFYGIAVSII